MSLNKVQLIGNVVATPEQFAAKETTVAKFTIATNYKMKDKEEASFHRIVCFGKLADTVMKYANKGKKVYIEGRLKYGSYEKDGQTKYTTDIIMEKLILLGGKESITPNQDQAPKPITDLSYNNDLPF